MTEPRLTCRECVEFLMDYLDDGLSVDDVDVDPNLPEVAADAGLVCAGAYAG